MPAAPTRLRASLRELYVGVRSVGRTAVVLAASLFCAFWATVPKPLRKPAPRLYYRIRNAVYRLWTSTLCWAWNVDVRVEGTPPTGGFFLVANHLGYLDIAVLGKQLHTTFVAKADLSAWPVAGAVIRSGDTIFIDRSRKRDLIRAREHVERTLADGLGVVLFAEGTSGKGDVLLPFKPSLLQIAAEHDIPVHWATLEYRTFDGEGPPSSCVCWWGDEGIGPHYQRFVRLNRIEAVVRFGERPIHGTDRKLLSDDLRAAMQAAFRAMA